MSGSETVCYEWYYRNDGKGTFRSSEPRAYKHGTRAIRGTDKSERPYSALEFGAFSIGWSGKTDGEGWVYYDHFAGDRIEPDSVRICVTDETDIEKVDATDSKWLYKGSPSDPGVTASGKPK